jgi:protein subunit release factor A
MTEEDFKECKIEVYYSGHHQKGGQHINTTPAGIKMTCEKYGLTAISDGARSQHINRQICYDMIEMALTYKDKIR